MEKVTREYEGAVEVSDNGAWEYHFKLHHVGGDLNVKTTPFISKTIGGFSSKAGAEKGCRAAIAAYERNLLAQEYKESQKLVFTITADEVPT